MGFLLDTHAFLWFLGGDKKLPKPSRKIIKDINQDCYLSVASLWEMTIKIQLKKLEVSIPIEDIYDFLERNQIILLPIEIQHLSALSKLDAHHQDPFDRLIISQGISEGLTVISGDSWFHKYPVSLFWD